MLRNVVQLLLSLTAGVSLTTRATVLEFLPAADTALFENVATNNLGAMNFMPVGFTGASTRTRGLLKFNLAQIPSNATVTDATLRVTVTFGNGPGITCDVHRMLQSWIEGNQSGGPDNGILGAPAASGEPTWSHRAYATTPWGAPGAQAGVDYVTTASAAISVISPATYTFASATLLANVQSWINNPATNHGWLLKDRNESTLASARRFASREDLSTPPVLTVGYTTPPPVVLTNARAANNQFRFSFVAVSNQSHTVEATTALGSVVWSTVTNYAATNVTLTRTITNALTASNRFYRVKVP